MQLRSLTGELGCISISPIFSGIQAQNSLDEEGNPVAPHGHSLENQVTNCFKQLEWMADAMKKQRETVGIPK